MPRLQFFRGPESLLDYRLSPGRTTIGRADSCDIALPGDEISRTHCMVEGSEKGWMLIDRSKHGTRLNGTPIEGRAVLEHGARIALGPYTVEFRLDQQEAGPTAESIPDRGHEVLVATDAEIHVERATLTVVGGPNIGTEAKLNKSMLTLGSAPSDIVLNDPSLVPKHVRVRTSRGRVMLEPGDGAAWVDGERVRDILPLHAGEEFTIGETVLRVDKGIDDETPFAHRFGDMVGESRPMQKLFGLLRRVSGHHAPVLLVGESGTGKELAARGVHESSARSGGPYIPINCGAIQPSLFESELFGHEKGSFTGAIARKDGAFHLADHGTLFLDEIGELPEEAQSKLLRALETGEVRRVGGVEVGYPDVRVVAATNRSLVDDVRRGRFREDLFFRLAVLTVDLPSLRERPEDLPLLVGTILKTIHPEARVSPQAMELLAKHDWPGNVRELRNVLTRAFVLEGPSIEPNALSFHDLTPRAAAPEIGAAGGPTSLEDAERSYIVSVLRRHGENRSSAAREIGIARSSLHYKMKRLGIK
jgi:two-component system, NtrC family, response regulator HydG